MPTVDVIYTGTDGSRHLLPYSYRCLLKIEDINHQSGAVTDSNYMFTVDGPRPVGMEPCRFPSGWGGSRTLARSSSYEKSHVSLCHATGHLTLSILAFHHLVSRLRRRSKHQNAAKALFVVYCHVRSPALLAKWSEF